jgi:hypothetical protein
VEQQRSEPLDPRFEGELAIRFPEEPRVAQPRVTTRSALRAIVRSLSGSVLMTARNAFFQLPVFAFDRKVMLMMNQRRRQHFSGSSRNSSANVPATTDGASTRSGTSRSSPASLWTVRPTRSCSRCAFASSSRAIL